MRAIVRNTYGQIQPGQEVLINGASGGRYLGEGHAQGKIVITV